MGDLTNNKRKSRKNGDEMKGLAQDMGSEMREMREYMKVKAERLGDEIKKRMMR